MMAAFTASPHAPPAVAMDAARLAKTPTGIAGFDDLTGGGLPQGRTTLIVGGPGSGKTIFAMQCLVHGARHCQEPGIFVTFEESPARIAVNFEGFGWGLAELQPEQLAIVDAQPAPDLVQSGTFDLGGMLAVLQSRARAMGARRIVFDALDVMLDLLPDAGARRREVYRLHDWLNACGYTALITSKSEADTYHGANQTPYGFMQFMVDCAVVLNHSMTFGVSQRNLRVQKYRGSSFDENESPFVIGPEGLDVAVTRRVGRVDTVVSAERIGSGVARLDTMLGGGYYRGATVLITGFPGTAKTTLSGAFAEAACGRGERTLFVSFDSDGTEVVRNVSSVGIRLDHHVASGVLRMVSARTILGSAETLLVRIKALARSHGARCIVIDPVSTLSTAGNELTAHAVAERLIDWSKAEGVTLVCTSLLDELTTGAGTGSPLHVSTLADTWIHLSYLVQAGERNRGLSIIKSRGTAHSNQVRELVLGDEGVTLADIYTAGGEVLMGTLRWEKERAVRLAEETAEVAARLKRVLLDSLEAELEVRLKSLQTELVAKRTEKALLAHATRSLEGEASQGHTQLRELRGADDAPSPRQG
jgi:circadian clock protein KaiC